MKNVTITFCLIMFMVLASSSTGFGQANLGNIANVQQWKMKHVDGGTPATRDSLLNIYNDNVIKKNEYILSHREYRHFYTGDSKEYFIIEEFKDLAAMEKASLMTTELEMKAWPDEAKRTAFMDAMNSYFENWHGDAIYSTNSKLSKN